MTLITGGSSLPWFSFSRHLALTEGATVAPTVDGRNLGRRASCSPALRLAPRAIDTKAS
jgi:hypothetical protein